MHFGDNCPYYFVSFIWLSICSRQAFLLCHHRLLKFELIASAIYILKAHLHYGKKLKFQFILGNGWFHSAEKTARTPDVTGWGVSEGKASCLRVKHPALDIHLAKGSRVYQLHSDSSPGSCPAPLQEAWKAAPQPEVQDALCGKQRASSRRAPPLPNMQPAGTGAVGTALARQTWAGTERKTDLCWFMALGWVCFLSKRSYHLFCSESEPFSAPGAALFTTHSMGQIAREKSLGTLGLCTRRVVCFSSSPWRCNLSPYPCLICVLGCSSYISVLPGISPSGKLPHHERLRKYLKSFVLTEQFLMVSSECVNFYL